MYTLDGIEYSIEEIQEAASQSKLSVDEYISQYGITKIEDPVEIQEPSLTLDDLMPGKINPTDMDAAVEDQVVASDMDLSFEDTLLASQEITDAKYSSAEPEEKIKLLKNQYEPLGFTVDKDNNNTVNISNNKGQSQVFNLKEQRGNQGTGQNFGAFDQPTPISPLESIKDFVADNQPESLFYKDIYKETKQLPDDYASLLQEVESGPLTVKDFVELEDTNIKATAKEQLNLINTTRGLITRAYEDASSVGLGTGGVGSEGYDEIIGKYEEQVKEEIFKQLGEKTKLDINFDDFNAIYNQVKESSVVDAKTLIQQKQNLIKASSPSPGFEVFKQKFLQTRIDAETPKSQERIRLLELKSNANKQIEGLNVLYNNAENLQDKEAHKKNILLQQDVIKSVDEKIQRNAQTPQINPYGVAENFDEEIEINKQLSNSVFSEEGDLEAKEQRKKVNRVLAKGQVNQIKLNQPNLSDWQATRNSFDQTVSSIQRLQSDASDQYITVNIESLNATSSAQKLKSKFNKAGYFGDKEKVSLLTLNQLGITYKDLNDTVNFGLAEGDLNYKKSVEEDDLVSVEMYEETLKEKAGIAQSLFELSYKETDPANVEKPGFVKNLVETAVVETVKKLGFTEEEAEKLSTLGQGPRSRVVLDRLNEAAAVAGLGENPWTEEQANNIEKVFSEQVSEGVGGFVPIMAELAAMNLVTGGALGITGATKVLTNLKSQGLYGKTLYHATMAMIEEGKLQTVGFKPGGGVAFYTIGQATSGIKQPFGKTFNFLNPIFEKVIKAGPVGAASLEVAQASELAYDSFMGNADFKKEFDKNYGDLEDVTKRMLVNMFVFSIAGTGHLKANDMMSTQMKARAIKNIQETQDQLARGAEVVNTFGKKSQVTDVGGATTIKKTYDIDGKSVSKEVFDQYTALQDAKKDLVKQVYLESDFVKLDPKSKNFESDLSSMITNPINAAIKAIVPGYEGFVVKTGEGKNFTQGFKDKKAVAEFQAGKDGSPDVVLLDTSRPDLIQKAMHEMSHASLKAYFSNPANSNQKRNFIKDLSEIFSDVQIPTGDVDQDNVQTGKTITGKEFGKEVDKVYNDKDFQTKQEEFLTNIIEQLSDPIFYFTEVAPTVVSELKLKLKDFFLDNGINAPQPTNAKQLVNALSNVGFQARRGNLSVNNAKTLAKLGDIDLLGVEYVEGKQDLSSQSSREITSENIETAKENKKLFDKIGEKSEKTIELENLVKKLKNDSKNLTGEDLSKKEKIIKKVEEDLAERDLADAALVKEEILENNRGLITDFVKLKFIDGLGISRDKFTQGVELEIRDNLLRTYSKDKGEIGAYLRQALFGGGGFGGGRLGGILKGLGQEGDLFNKSLDSKEAQSKLNEEIIPENIKKTSSKIDLAIKRTEKEQKQTIENLDAYLKQTGKSIEDMYRGNIPDLNQAATEKMLGLKPGALNVRKQGKKPRQFSSQELKNVQNEFTSDPTYYRKLLPAISVVPLEAKSEFKGRSLNLGKKVLQAFYEITDKRSSGEKSQPYIYKLREEFKGISAVADAAFLKQIGKVKGEQAIVDPRGSTGSTTQALARKVGEFITNKVIRDKLVNEPNNKNIIEDIAAGGSNSFAARILFRDKSPKEIENFRKIAKLISKGEIDKAQNEYPFELKDVEDFLIESKIEEVLALKRETSTFKKLVSQLPEFFDFNGEKISKKEIFSGGIGTGMVSTKNKVYKIYDKVRIEQQLEQAASWARTWPPELKQLLTKNTLLQSLGLTQATTGMNVQSKGKKKDKLTKEGKKVYEDPFFTEQANRLYNEIGKDYKGEKIFSKDLLNNIAEKGIKGIDQQKNAFKKYLETGDIKDLKKAINESDNAQKVALYDFFQNSLQDWLYSSTNKQEFINKAKYIFQSAASNTNLIMGFGRQFVPVEAVLIKPNSTLSKLKIEHAKTSLKQSMDAATAVVEGRYDVDGTKISKDYTGFLSYKKYLDVIDNLGGTTNLAGRDRMVLDFENLKNYATVASGFKKSLYNEILENAAKEFNTNTKLLDNKYLIDQLSSFGLSKTPVSKVLLKTAIDNAKQYAEVWKTNKILAEKSGIENFKELSPLQIIEKLKQKDKTNQEELIESYASRDLDLAFNEIIENKTGIGKEKTYSKAKAAVVGAKAGKIKLIASSAQDFEGLLYRTLGKGKIGDTQKKFYEEFLYRPLAQAEANLATDRVTMANNFKALKKQLKVSPKDLRKNIEKGEPWSKEQAIRVHIWNKQGITVPDLSKSDLKLLDNFVKNDPKLEAYAEELILLGKGTPYAEPGKNWEVGSITSDLIKGIQTTKRSEYLAPFISNADIMFSEKNLNKLEAAFGVNYRKSLENSLARIKAGKNRLFFNSDSGSALENRVLDYINNSTGAIMFFNTRSAVLQTLSAANFLNFKENNPLAAGKAFANQKQYWKDFSKLMNSDYLVDRRQGVKLNVAEAEIADAVHDQTNKPKAALNYILRKGFLPTQFADSFAIASGGATYYRNRVKMYEKEGLSTKDAERKAYLDFMDTAEKSQQSSKAQRISMQQASNLGRVVLAFANTPSQYLRLSQKAASDLMNGRGSKTENISKLAYYSLIQNLLFTTLQQATVGLLFDEDEEDTKQAKSKIPEILSASFDNLARGAGIAGAAAVTAKSIAMKIHRQSTKKRPEYSEAAYDLLTFSPPIRSKVMKLRSALRTVDYAGGVGNLYNMGPTLDNPSYLAGANVVSAFTNVPIDRVVKKVNNIRGAMNEENALWQRIALSMGWGRYELGLPFIKVPKAEKKKSGWINIDDFKSEKSNWKNID